MPTERPKYGVCELCGCQRTLSFHHLIPRKLHKRAYYKKHYSREFLHNHGLNLCRLCHRKVHKLFDESTLGRTYNTREKLLGHPEMQRFLVWARKQKKR